MQAGGHRFDPDRLHQSAVTAAISGELIARVTRTASAACCAIRRGLAASDGAGGAAAAFNKNSRDEDTISGLMAGQRGFALRFFDIVNGFLIDAVAHWCVVQGPHAIAALTDVVNLAEIIRPRL